MKKLWEFLRQHTMKIINFKKEKMKIMNNELQESYENAKFCYIFKENFENKYLKKKYIVKLEIIVFIQGNTEVLLIEYII